MVNRKTALGRFAFTMIELIFAIVVISIAVITLPMMAQITSKGIEENIVQEAIFAASAELMGATSYYWDAYSMNDYNLSHLERVIDIGGVCENNSSDPDYRLRLGHVNQPYHRRCLDSSAINIPANTSGGVFPTLNDATHGSELIFTDATKNATGYKNNYYSIVSISNVDETGATDNNIKKITVTVTDSDDNNITALSVYSTNIGEIDFYKRRF
ncbi:type II secretion system protein [Sulfurimonas sp.]|uniref:type II secretion system protein n=1 Tax=Sulfurimonas sp. TaxID=2022749 RepID=UPI0025F5A7B2|nr:type II secretion system protein [Sulfurimonas sp.]MBW6487764.1 type II secretion system GspH family protein [Sulfurimonas sp.]